MIALTAVICLLAPNPRSVATAARHPQGYVDSVGPDEAALTGLAALAWCVLAWFALGLAFTAAAALPGAVGRWCDRAADRVLPTAFRRTAALVLGVSVAATGGVASAKALFASGGAPRELASISLADPIDRHLPEHAPPELRLDWPTTPAAPSAPAAIDPDWPTATPTERHAPPTPPRASDAEQQTVVVHAGDTLWHLAAAHLGQRLGRAPTDAQIAAEWPRWHDANRAVIGADPDLLHPGQQLVVPR